MYRTLGVLALLALYVGLVHSFFWDVSAPHQVVPQKDLASEGGTATLRYLFPGNQPPKITRKFPQLDVHQQRTRHKRQAAGLYLPATYVIPGGEGDGQWGEWGEVSPCSRTCGGGVASQKRICFQSGPEGPQCTGGDTKYFSCQTQNCPDGSGDFRAEQCAEFNDKAFSGLKYNWVPYTMASNPCELYCKPHGERFYFRHKLQVTDGTRCNHESFDVCVNGKCQPVGCDMMLNSTAREDKCRECRGNGADCRTTNGILDSQYLIKGYNDILLLPAGSTSIYFEELKSSNNYLALRAQNGTYFLNGYYYLDFPGTIMIAGALWTYESGEQGNAMPDKLWCLGPTTEPLYLSLLLVEDENVGIMYEYSVPNNSALPTDKQYNWVHDEFTPCSATCGGGFQTRDVTCRSTDELEIVDASFCDDGLRPPTNQSCSPDPCPAQWVEGPWGECSQRCGSGGVKSREVTCQKIIDIGIKLVVPDKECFDLLGPKPEVFQKCNDAALSSTWFVGHWKPCNKLCDKGKQTRLVFCYQKKNGSFEELDDENCTEEKPEEEQPCMLRPCDAVDWVTSSWSECDSCTSKFRTRTVMCATKSRQVLNESFCSHFDRPDDHEECHKDVLPACGVKWYATEWSKCSVNCGDGVHTREVFCGMYYDGESGKGVEMVEEAKCANLTKYNDTKPCTVPKEECPSQWFAGPWSACSEGCGGGEQYRRVMCLQGDKEATDCEGTTVLESVQFCNTGPCRPATGREIEDGASPCSTSPYGCCQDDKTPAHGPDLEGCCLLQAFGCCPDNRKPAEGPHLEGCACQYALHGCCPDNVTVAQGPDNQGCGCLYTRHGCCPDRHTTASGPNNEGCACNTYQFGCCADGVTIAKGPEQEGCHCRESKFGCCGDGKTHATGPDTAGCDCSSSWHRCCPDGRTEATGPFFLGCTDAPENKQAACSMLADPGPCHNFTTMWYFDLAFGGCSRFWYGGCDGNGNRFATKEECDDVCVHSSPKDVCKLPSVKGACDADYQRWHYNSTREQCMPFTYGGCLGNANNFDTQELCQKQCEPNSIAGPCHLPIDHGMCAGNYSRWGFNSKAYRCEQFVWGGCEGNSNRFSTEAACQMSCAGTQAPQCTQPQEAGNCTEKEARWSFSQSENRCLPFYYSGCGGNDNQFRSRETCEQTCPSAYVIDKCTLPAETGLCSNYSEKWFYDTTLKRCHQFTYGGCGGNENNFGTKAECDNSCSEINLNNFVGAASREEAGQLDPQEAELQVDQPLRKK